MKNLKSKVFSVVAMCLLPIVLMSFIETKSTTDYLWWEDAIGYFVIILLLYAYVNWAYSFIFKNDK